MLNHPEFVDVMVGSSIAGTVFVPIDPRTKGDKLTYMLGFAECKGIVVADYALDNLLGMFTGASSTEMGLGSQNKCKQKSARRYLFPVDGECFAKGYPKSAYCSDRSE